jgi:hypothetical protein
MMEGSITVRRNWLRRSAHVGLAVLLGFCIGLAMLEAFTRLFLPEFDPSGYVTLNYKVGSTLLPQPGVITRQKKNTGDYDVSIQINQHGLRDENNISEATPRDLIVVGDSFAWGWGVEAEQRFSNLVDNLIGVRTFNISSPSADLKGYADLLDYAHALGARAKRVVIMVCMENDLRRYHVSPQPDVDVGLKPIIFRKNLARQLAEQSALYVLAVTAIHRTPWLMTLAVRARLITPNLDGIGKNTNSSDVIHSSAAQLQAIAASYHALIVLIPSRGLWVGPNREIENLVHKAFKAALLQRGLDILDLQPVFEAGGNPLAFHFAQDGHWNPSGHLLAAQVIVDRLRADGPN